MMPLTDIIHPFVYGISADDTKKESYGLPVRSSLAVYNAIIDRRR